VKGLLQTVLLYSCLALHPYPLQSQADYSAAILAGISNHGKNQNKPYVTAGDRAYLIGTQDGNFPDLGGHVPGEMGGLWLHPIKLIDGFHAEVTETATGRRAALSETTEFINYPYGNRFKYGPVLDRIEIERFQFSPDGLPGIVVQYTFTNTSDRRRTLSFQFSVKTDLTPVWFSDRLGIQDAPDTVVWQRTKGLFLANDTGHSWFTVWGASTSAGAQSVADPEPIRTRGIGVTAASRHTVSVDPLGTSTLTFVVAGSARAGNAAEEAYRYLARHHRSLLAKKKAHYASIVERARIKIPDQRLQEVYSWVKINAEWLVRDVPGIGRGLGGGLMEYPWWFGTESYSLQALLATGDFELPKQTLRLLRNQSSKANGNGRIVHEVTTNGAVSNPGNSQETAQFILTAGKVFQWTGDLAFAKEMYPAMRQGLSWLLTDRDRNQNLFPEGYGIMEVSGLNAELIDVAVYTQQALLATAEIASALGDDEAATRYRLLGSRLAARINERFWLEEETSYADFYGTRAQALEVADGAIRQIGLKGADKLTERDKESIKHYERLKQKFSAMPDTSRGWITNENWVITTPMEMGIAPRSRAIRALDRIREENVGEYGPYLSAVEKQAMMTISTGVQAVSEGNYGRTEEALWYVDKVVQTFNRTLPGSISEMMPDWGCFTIAWTSYGIVLPLIQHIFGIRPDAVNKTVVFEPHVPAGWDEMSIEEVPVGTNLVSFSRARTGKGIEYVIESKQTGWNLVLSGNDLRGAKYYVNGRSMASDSSVIRLRGRRNHVLVVP
jgi:glycogen debranching enzyme